MEHRGRPSNLLDFNLRYLNKWRMAAAGLMLIAFAGLFACGEATDQPEDCRAGEFFDEASEECTPCPALSTPDCRDGCGFRIIEDERGCPLSSCALNDQEEGDERACLCENGQFFSDDTFSCQSCADAQNPPAICDEE